MVMGQKSQLWLDIPALETYDLLASIYRIPSPLWRDRVDSLAQLFQVHKQLKTPVRRLSLGERMKLEIIASLLHQPKLLILDEPTIGLDVVARRNIRSFLRDYIRQEKTTLLLSSHDMSDIAELCPRLVILQQGRLQYDGWVKDFERLHPEALFKKVALDFDFGAAISIEDWHKLADAHGAKLESQEVLSPVFLVPVGELGALVGQVLKHGTPIDIRVEETSLESLVHSMLVKS
jgi:ABC-2 type transport system ATP-binding protein